MRTFNIYPEVQGVPREYSIVPPPEDENFRYVRNFNPHLPTYQHIPYRLQQPLMREIIRHRDNGTLNSIQQQRFKAPRPAEELYVLSEDPYELNNVADDPRYRKQLKKLRKVLDDWIEETNDLGRIPEPELLKQMWGGQDHPPVTADPVIASDGTTIRITCPTEGASIGYQLVDPGETPSEQWAVYTGPFPSNGKTVVALAQRIGYLPSQTVTHSK